MPARITAQDQRAFIAISVASDVPCNEVISRLKKAVGRKNAYSDRQIRTLYKEFQENKRPDTDDQRCHNQRPLSATDQGHEEGIEHLMSIRRDWTIDELAHELGISHGSVTVLLNRLGYQKVSARWVPHELTDREKRNRVIAARENQRWFHRDARMLGRIIAFDETVWRCYTPPDPNQAAEYRRSGERPPTRVAQFREPWSRHLIMAVRQDQIIGFEWLNEGERWTQDTIIRFLNGTFRSYVESTMNSIGEIPIILMDGAAWHTGGRVMAFIRQEMGWEILNHPAWSPDFDPLDWEIFQSIKRPYKGKRYTRFAELDSDVGEIVDYVNANHSLIGTTNLPQVWGHIIDAKGDYYFD
jgi:histone-lysine N-methyltransferase SETMAR